MEALGRVLGLMLGAHNRFSTVALRAESFYDPAVRYAAVDHARATGDLNVGALGMPTDPASETVTTLWVAQPFRMRAEQSGDQPGGRSGPVLMVVDGERWWRYDEQWGARFGTGPAEQMSPFTVTGLESHLDPRALLGTRSGLRLGGATMVAGRQAAVLHARYGGRTEAMFDTEIAVDVELGVALRVVDRYEGQIVEVREVTSVAFDQPIADEVFTFAPPPGEELLPLPVTRSVSVEEAAAVCPFTAYVPAEIPAGSEAELTYWSGWQRESLPGASLRVHIRHGTDLVSIEQWEGFRCSWDDESPAEPVTRDGQTVFVSTDRNGGHRIELRRGDTGIELQCFGDRDLVVAMATCLVPASGDPPWARVAVAAGSIVGVPMQNPPPPPGWRHPDIDVPPALDPVWEAVFGADDRRAGFRATVTNTWYGGGHGPRRDPPATAEEEISAANGRTAPHGVGRYDALIDPGRMLASLDLEFGPPLQVLGRAAVPVTGRPCAWLQFPRRPNAIRTGSGLLDWSTDRVEVLLDRDAGFLLGARAYAGDLLVRTVEVRSVTLG